MYDVLILGGGPAGMTAAIYASRAKLKTLVVAGENWGGQLMTTSLVENFPGFPEGIHGPELMERIKKQAEKFGAEFIYQNFKESDFSKSPFKITAGDKIFEAKTVIIAMGASAKWLKVPGEAEKIGRGVSGCAPCDGPFFKEKDIIVAGGGDCAMEEAIILTRFAKSVTIIHRRDTFKASIHMLNRAKSDPKIKFIVNKQITKILGQEKVEGVEVKDSITGEISQIKTEGIFVAIGHHPNTAGLKGIEFDDQGYVKAEDHIKTNISGVFVAGDIHDCLYQQAITAAGYGCMAALKVEEWLLEK
ncbi:MAG: thioredoxin-disulfide reductase [Candidatus Levybacteria bacterium RBG_16_35_11]|nr:MAG: thioredoxin-disulfide reductase [Candidatus Levybacteria bacterium RBG_16_35_11]